MPRPVGRRERKKQQTREAIARAGLRLFAEHGFRETTVAQVAEAADVAESTFFLHFPSKDDLVFAGHAEEASRLVARLEHRPADLTTLDVVADYLHDLSEPARWDVALWALRKDVVRADPTLAAQERARWADVVQPALETAFARDFGDASSVRARLLASMAVGSIVELGRLERELDEARAGGSVWKRAVVDRLVAGLHAAADALAAG
jgi:AcrR family transcriptional regulator